MGRATGRRSLHTPLPPRRTTAQRVAMDAARIVERLNNDRDLAVLYWNQYRSRELLVESMDSAYRSWTTAELIELDLAQIEAVEAFYGAVLRLQHWAELTEVMPATLEQHLDLALPPITALGEAAIGLLGGRPPPPPPPKVPETWTTLHR